MDRNKTDWTIGYKLKKIRTSKGLTLKEVAGQLDVTPAFLSMLENGKSGTSFSNMQRLLQIYDVTLAEFSDDGDPQSDIVIPLEKGRLIDFNDEKIEARLLNNQAVKDSIELIYFRLEPGASIDFHQHEGVEFIHILEGTLYITLIDSALERCESHYTLMPGDTMHQKSTWLHKCANTTKKPCIFLAGVYPATF